MTTIESGGSAGARDQASAVRCHSSGVTSSECRHAARPSCWRTGASGGRFDRQSSRASRQRGANEQASSISVADAGSPRSVGSWWPLSASSPKRASSSAALYGCAGLAMTCSTEPDSTIRPP